MDRTELAGFLRSRRGRVRPADVGLAEGQRRRTPGLRREEVAALAGMSADYYIRLEQARGPHPSAQLLGALARALRLSGDERDHLFHLAGQSPSPQAQVAGHVRPAVLHLLDRLGPDIAAMVVDHRYTVLAWNRLAAALMCDFSALAPAERNILYLHFLGADFRQLFTEQDWWHSARAYVADVRASAARLPHDQTLARSVALLRARSEEFARLWAEHDVEVRRSMTKRFRHPVVGEIELHCEVLLVPEPDQRLIIQTAEPGSPSAEAMELLQAVGLQDLTPAQQHT